MAKYQNAYSNDENEDERVEADTVNSGPPLSSEEASFKKRYGDLRRHMQTEMAQKDTELEKMQTQLQSATTKQIKFPKTADEVAQWVEKYPDVAAIIDTIAQRRVTEGMGMNKGAEKKIAQLENKLNRATAEKELRKLHPDFDQIRGDSNFHDWVALQPATIRDALYKNTNDPAIVARCLDLYKTENKIKTKTRSNRSSAAQAVGKTSSSSSPSTGKARYSESQVEAMSAREYEQNEDAIFASMQNGTFEYDQSGAAR